MTHEIIVVDNASRDNSVETIQKLFPHVRVIVNKKNLGHPGGNNMGLRAAKGEYIAMINEDLFFRNADEIQNILLYMDQHTDTAFLGPKLHELDGKVQYSCFRKYSLLTPVYRRTFFGKLPSGKKDVNRFLMTDFDHNQTCEVEWLLGACLFIRKKAMDEIGIMNDKFFLYFGDFEWCNRARQKGWKVVYYHNTRFIYHFYKRESAAGKFSFTQALSYTTRIHIKDWITYLTIK